MIDPIMGAQTGAQPRIAAPDPATEATEAGAAENVSYLFNPIAPSEEAYAENLETAEETGETVPWMMSPSEGAEFMARLAEMAEAAGEDYRHPGLVEVSSEKYEPANRNEDLLAILNRPIDPE